jgi:hypothetical protein
VNRDKDEKSPIISKDSKIHHETSLQLEVGVWHENGSELKIFTIVNFTPQSNPYNIPSQNRHQ